MKKRYLCNHKKLLSNLYIDDGKTCILLTPSQEGAKKQFLRKVKDGSYEYVKLPCDCGNSDFEVVSQKDRYGIPVQVNICKKCGLIITSPTLDQESLNAFYNCEYRHLYVSDARPTEEFFWAQVRHGDKILKLLSGKMKIGNESNILEIGTGAGGILYSIKNTTGARVVGIDLGSEYLDFGRRYGLDLQMENAQEHAKKHKHAYDLVILSHVIEHFLNLESEIESIKELLTKDGKIYVEVPGIKWSKESYGSFMLAIQNAHIRYFSLETLKQTLERYGLVLVEGDEMIHAIFEVGEKGDPDRIQNYYNDILDYLNSLEANTGWYLRLRYHILGNKVLSYIYRILKRTPFLRILKRSI